MIPAPSNSFRMARFVPQVEPLGPAGQRDALRHEAALQGQSLRQADNPSDGFCLTLFGITAVGLCEADAGRSWLCQARTLLGGFPEIDPRPEMRMPQITWAMHILHHWQTTPTHHLRAACRIILSLSHNTALRGRADHLARTYDLYPLNLQS